MVVVLGAGIYDNIIFGFFFQIVPIIFNKLSSPPPQKKLQKMIRAYISRRYKTNLATFFAGTSFKVYEPDQVVVVVTFEPCHC